jgi:uncharacterized damage-inducible protein DinB
MTTERAEPGLQAGEREMLTGWLDYHRATLAWKWERSVPPSGLSLIGLVRHMAEVERSWFRNVLHGAGLPFQYSTPDDMDADFNDTGSEDGATALRTWEQECAAAREAIVGVDLDALSEKGDRRTGEPFSLRWILTHMIEEYARHNGHADLLRERIDGATGD